MLKVSRALARLLPGLLLTAGVTVMALALARVETRVLGRPVIDALVIAIALGILIRSLRPLPAAAATGVRFAARELLDVAVFLLGASVDLPLLLKAGPVLAAGIVGLVALALAIGYGVARAARLRHTHAVLVAAGNAICGNSAIVAVAAVMDTEPEEVASAIAFTAVLSIALVLALPLVIPLLGLSEQRYGALAGLTVYAVPQVLAATIPVGPIAAQMGTMVKLGRVLLLGPLVLVVALSRRKAHPATPRLTQFIPWFIIGFVALAALRSAGVLPASVLTVTRSVSAALTLLAMAALGIECDARALVRAGWRVATAVTGALVAILLLALGLIRLLP